MKTTSFDDDDHHDVEDGILLLSLKVLSIFSSTYRKDLGAIETTERLFLSLLIEVLEPARTVYEIPNFTLTMNT